ncbi:sigma-70 family RNA polymerase sigma factor [Eisenbergiella sp.]
MAEKYGIPDYKKMYPDASEEVIAELRRTERKIRYQEHDLKVNGYEIKQEERKVIKIPGREDSLERLVGMNKQFVNGQPSVEEEVFHKIMCEQLHRAFRMLEKEEQDLIYRLYFKKQSEREAAYQLGISQNAINKRRHKILGKLRKNINYFL